MLGNNVIFDFYTSSNYLKHFFLDFRILRKMDANLRHSSKGRRSSQYFDQTHKVSTSTFSKVPLSDNSSADSHNLLGKGIPSGFISIPYSLALPTSTCDETESGNTL